QIQWQAAYSDHLSHDSFYNKMGTILKDLNTAGQYRQKIKWGDSVLSDQLKYLKTYKEKLSPDMYAVIEADIIANNYFYFRNFWGLRNIDSLNNERNTLLQMVNDSFKMPSEPHVIANSWASIRYL